jgi:phage gpG-like protein
MTGSAITLDNKQALDVLNAIYAAAGDTRGALKNIGEYEAPATVDRIRQEISPDGTPFKPLNPLYAETKQGRGNSQGILRGMTGDLSSIIYQLASDTELQVGTNVIYGAAHQFGAVIKPVRADALVFSMGGRVIHAKSVTIPKRTFLGWSDADIAEIINILTDFYFAATEENGG